MAVGTYGKLDGSTLYFKGTATSGYTEYTGGEGSGSKSYTTATIEEECLLPSDCSKMFYNSDAVTSINNIKLFNTSNVTIMSYMFCQCYYLTSLDLTGGDTSNVTDMSYMFDNCYRLETIDGLEDFNTSKVTTMVRMFSYNGTVEALDLYNFDMSSVEHIDGMFKQDIYGGANLKYIRARDGRYLEDKGVSYTDMFYNCENLPNYTSTRARESALKCAHPSYDTWVYPEMPGFFTGLETYYKVSGSCLGLKGYQDDGYTLYEGGDDRPPWRQEISSYYSVIVKTNCILPEKCCYMFEYATSFTGLEKLETDNVKSMKYFFGHADNDNSYLKIPEEGNTSNVTDMSYMFYDLGVSTASVTLDITNLNTSSVTDMNNMFYSFGGGTNSTVKFSSSFDTSNVTDMSGMFSGTTWGNFASFVKQFNTSKVTNMSSMFDGGSNNTSCTYLDLSNGDTSNVTDMSYMFNSCSQNVNLSSGNTSKVTSMRKMFFDYRGSSSLNLSNFDTSNVTDMGSMFSGTSSSSSSIKSLNLCGGDTSKVTDMSNMFCILSQLSYLDLTSFNVENVTNFDNMFEYCSNLQTIKAVDGDYRYSSSTSDNMFYYCVSLPGYSKNNIDLLAAHNRYDYSKEKHGYFYPHITYKIAYNENDITSSDIIMKSETKISKVIKSDKVYYEV